jgi:hypothetical protein
MTDYYDQVKLNTTTSSLTADQFLKSFSVSAGGSGYTSAPTITIDPPTQGTQATATASIVDPVTGVGPITGVAILSGGSGYTSHATVDFSPAGASATPVLDANGQIIAIILDPYNLGNYASPPTVTINPHGYGGSGANLQATMSVQAITVTNAGTGYTSDPNVTIGAPTGPASVYNQATAYAKVKSGGSVDVLLGTFPKGSSYLTLNSSGNSVDAFEVITSDGNPLLTVNKGAIIEKDLLVGGFVDSWQGAINLNYGLKGRPVLSSPPCIQMFASATPYPSGTTLPPNPETGQLFNHNGTNKLWNGNQWITGNYTGHYDTLFLFQVDGATPAHLDLGNLTAHGTVGFGTAGYLLSAGSGNAYFCQNTYLSDAWRYINTDVASIVRLSAGALTFMNAPSGAKDSACSWTERMRVTAGGVLQVDSIQKLDGSAFPFWNGGTVSNDIQINKAQPCLKLYYGGVGEWVLGQYVSGSSTLYFNSWNGGYTAMALGTAGNLTLTNSLTTTNVILTNNYGGITGTGIEVFLQPRTNDGMVTIYNHATDRAPLRFWEANQCMTLDSNNISLNAPGNLGISGSFTLASGCVLSNDTNDTLRIASGAHSGQGSSVTIGAQNSGLIHFMSNGGLPFYFNEQLQVKGWISLYRQGVGAVGSFMDWTSGGWQGTTPSNGIATNGDFYVNGNQVLAGGLQFNQGGTAAYIIWANNYVLTVGADGSSPFVYVKNGVTRYFGAIDCGAVFCQNLQPIGDVNYVDICGNIRAEPTHLYSYYGGGPGGASGGVYWDTWGNFVFNGGSANNTWSIFATGGSPVLTLPNSNSNTHSSTVWTNLNPGSDNNYGLGSGSNRWAGITCMNVYDSALTGGSNHAVYATSTGQLTNTSSSQRYKQNIETLTDCSWIYNLRPVDFDWRDDEQARIEGRQIGLIAEEVYVTNPQLAWLNSEGQPEGVHYEKLGVPMLVELQRLKAEVDQLKAQLAAA